MDAKLAAVALVALLVSVPLAGGAVSYGSKNETSSGSTSVTTRAFPKPSGVAAGDLLVAQVVVSGGTGTAIGAPAGWTLALRTDRTTSLASAVYWRVAGSAEPSSFTFSFTPAALVTGAIMRVRGVDPISPVAASAGATASGKTVSVPSVLSTSGSGMLVLLCASNVKTTFTQPANMTERYDNKNGVSDEAATQSVAAGGTGARPCTAGTSGEMVGQLLALTDFALPVVAFSTATSSAAEGAGEVGLVVNLSKASPALVTVNYAATGGTAVGGGADYALSAGTVTFNPGETTRTLSVAVADDAVFEPDETIVVTLSGATNALLGAVANRTHTILNDDPQPAVAFTASTMRGSESVTTVSLTVSLSAASTQPVSVVYSTGDGSATAGADYPTASGTLAFSAGSTSATVALSVTNDALHEADETFAVGLSTPLNATLGALSTLTYTIEDDDAAPLARFAATDASVAETVGTASLSVLLSAPSGLAAQVDYALAGGNATLGADLNSTAGTLVFAPGETSKAFTVQILDDTLAEPDETAVFALASSSGAILGTPTTTTLTILDDESAPTLRFASSTSSVSEGAGSSPIGLTLAPASSGPVTVAYRIIGGNATPGDDYSAQAGSLTIPAGTSAATIPFSVIQDATSEPDESVVLEILNATGASLASPTQHTRVIVDDDPLPPTASFDAATSSALEGAGEVSLDVVLSFVTTTAVSVPFSVAGGSATDGTDYTLPAGPLVFAPGETRKPIRVHVLDDDVVEADETLTLALGAPTGATLGALANRTHTVLNDDLPPPTVQFEATASSVTEANTVWSVAVTLSRASTRPVQVAYAVSGATATEGADYSLPAADITFLPGATRALLEVTIVDDTLVEPTETIPIALSMPVNATLGAASVHTVGVIDDDSDAPPVVGFETTAASASEAVTAITFNVVLSFAATADVQVSYAVTGGSATRPSDYTLAPAVLLFAPGEVTRTVSVTVVNDAINEPDETFVVALSNPVNATLGAAATHTQTILNDDAPTPTVSFETSADNAGEATTPVAMAVVLSNAATVPVRVDYAVTGGTATNPADYTLAPGSLLFSVGQVRATITMGVLNDNVSEPDETVIITLSNPVNATLGTTTHTQTILNDDAAPTQTLSVASAPVFYNGTPDGSSSWGGWTAQAGATDVAATNYLKIVNTGSVANPRVVVSFGTGGFAGASDGNFVIPTASNLEFAWWEDTTPGSSAPSEGAYTWTGGGASASTTVAFTTTNAIVYVAYRIHQMPDVLPAQSYAGSFTVTEI